MFNIKPSKVKLNDLKLNEIKTKPANQGKSKIGEPLNNYNSFREAIDNEMQYKTKVEETKNIIKKFKIT